MGERSDAVYAGVALVGIGALGVVRLLQAGKRLAEKVATIEERTGVLERVVSDRVEGADHQAWELLTAGGRRMVYNSHNWRRSMMGRPDPIPVVIVDQGDKDCGDG